MTGETRLTADEWLASLRRQLDMWWSMVLRPRFEGLTDQEYFWEPAPGCWNVRPTSEGRFAIDWARPEPQPPPVTTIGWRLCHIGSTLVLRVNHHFGDRSLTIDAIDWPGTASGGIAMVEDACTAWSGHVAALDEAALAGRSQGPPGTLDGQFPFADVVLHVNREVLSHGAEIALLRDLYRARDGRP
jgi:hypothetical protein